MVVQQRKIRLVHRSCADDTRQQGPKLPAEKNPSHKQQLFAQLASSCGISATLDGGMFAGHNCQAWCGTHRLLCLVNQRRPGLEIGGIGLHESPQPLLFSGLRRSWRSRAEEHRHIIVAFLRPTNNMMTFNIGSNKLIGLRAGRLRNEYRYIPLGEP